jgi:FMN phosphatase YigB (HAD superfamily)
VALWYIGHIKVKLLISDLDNTLFDWVSFYAQSFESMAIELAKLLDIPLVTVLKEYQLVHQQYANTEKPFATLALPCVKAKYGHAANEVMLAELSPVFNAFNMKRNETLRLYPSVIETLIELKRSGVKLVAHTESLEFNAVYRMNKLGLVPFFDRLYTTADINNTHPCPQMANYPNIAQDFVERVDPSSLKPNAELLLSIIKKEGASIGSTIYIGDSIRKDIAMANSAGVTSVWAKYGRDVEKKHWDVIEQISHWTNEAFQREKSATIGHIVPTHEILCFSEILSVLKAEQKSSIDNYHIAGAQPNA